MQMQTHSKETPLMTTKRNQSIYKLMTTILLWFLKKEFLPRKLLQEINKEPGIVPDDVDPFREISEAQILNIDSKIPEFVQEFLREESFSEIGKNILKYTNLFKSPASRLIFMTIFSLSPVFSKKYENLSWETITTRAQKRIQQEKANNLNQNEIQEKLDENFSSKPLMKKPRGRPRKNLLTNLKNISSQTIRKRCRPRKQIYKDELPEINMQIGSRTKVELDFNSDPDYWDYLKQTQAKNRKKKNDKPKNITEPECEEI